jgi:hypothetical protein
MVHRAGRKTDVVNESIFLENEVIGWEYGNGGVGTALVEVRDDPWSGVFVFWLNDHRARSSIRQLPAHFGSKMVFGNDGQNLSPRD